MTIRMHIPELVASLAEAERQLDRHLPRALALAGRLVRDRARSTRLFRDRTGTLRRSIGAPAVTGTWSGGDLTMRLEAGIGNVRYARFVHDGTRAHAITTAPPGRPSRLDPSRPGALRWAIGGSRFAFARAVRHPGTAPRPFMYQALEAVQPEVARIVGSAARLAFVSAGFEVMG